MTDWKAAASLLALRRQIDAAHPDRDHSWDGLIGDEAHQQRKSDHDPNERNIVCAMDITHDPVHGVDGAKLSEALRLSKDPRISYVIFNRRIFSSTVQPWVWRPYNGTSPHDHHVHISVFDDERPWAV